MGDRCASTTSACLQAAGGDCESGGRTHGAGGDPWFAEASSVRLADHALSLLVPRVGDRLNIIRLGEIGVDVVPHAALTDVPVQFILLVAAVGLRDRGGHDLLVVRVRTLARVLDLHRRAGEIVDPAIDGDAVPGRSPSLLSTTRADMGLMRSGPPSPRLQPWGFEGHLRRQSKLMAMVPMTVMPRAGPPRLPPRDYAYKEHRGLQLWWIGGTRTDLPLLACVAAGGAISRASLSLRALPSK
jgi:hypothetical protein